MTGMQITYRWSLLVRYEGLPAPILALRMMTSTGETSVGEVGRVLLLVRIRNTIVHY